MNAPEFTNVNLEQETGSTTDAAPPHPRVRRALLLGIALLSVWLSLAVHRSINDLQSGFDEISANLELPSH